ncbi:MAG: hypothetical protein R6V59_06130, partial [Dehalococcoidia bacterium]
VPPLPLATDIIILFPDHFGTALGAAYLVAWNTRLVRSACPTTGTYAISSGACSGSVSTHPAPATATS